MPSPNLHDVVVRQFARAVLADRLVGDELARLAMARQAAAPIDSGDALKAFMETWRGLRNASDTAPPFSDRALSASLPPPPPPSRLLVLLVDVMGYSLDAAAHIIEPFDGDIDASLAQGRAALVARPATAIVIEDEPLIAAELRLILEGMGLTVAGSAATAGAAVALADASTPDLIIADYNLEQPETGADAVKRIRVSNDCPVIFITGFPEKVLAGSDVEPDFVISKPYRLAAIRAAVVQCLDVHLPATTENAP